MRPEPYELNPDNYSFSVEIPTRFEDVDSNNHVNNVAVASLFQESRLRFAIYARGKKIEEMRAQARVVAVSILINYLGEIYYPQPVIISVGVSKIGTSSYTLGCLMCQDGKPVAHSKAIVVRSEDGQSSPLPMDIVEALSECLIKQG